MWLVIYIYIYIYIYQVSFKSEGLLKVTGSHVHSKCVNISETMQDGKIEL